MLLQTRPQSSLWVEKIEIGITYMIIVDSTPELRHNKRPEHDSGTLLVKLSKE